MERPTYELKQIGTDLRKAEADPDGLLEWLRTGTLVASIRFPGGEGALTPVPISTWMNLPDASFRAFRKVGRTWKRNRQRVPGTEVAAEQIRRLQNLLRALLSHEITESDRATAAELLQVTADLAHLDGDAAAELQDQAIRRLLAAQQASEKKFVVYVTDKDRRTFFERIGVELAISKRKRRGGRKRLTEADDLFLFIVKCLFSGQPVKQDAIIADTLKYKEDNEFKEGSREWIRQRVSALYQEFGISRGTKGVKVKVEIQ